MIVLGGCHVAGYPIGPAHAFPALLGEVLDATLVAQVPNLQFLHLPQHLPAIAALSPSHVVLQLGNYEFSASLRNLLHQFNQAFGRRPVKKKFTKKASRPPAQLADVPVTTWLVRYVRLAGLGPLTAVLWLLSAQHRRAFHTLNACMRQHPDTAFVFLSPLPCLDPVTNTMRRFGGWLLRRRLAHLSNCQWLDSHQLVQPDRHLFVDLSHLNSEAHRTLAYGLAAALLSYVDFLQ